jgi:hypothetical protein
VELPGDVEALAIELRAIETKLSELRIAKADVEARLYDAMNGNKVVDLPPPIGRIERGWTGTREAWESPVLFKQLLHCAVDPEATGEVPSAAEAIQRVQEMVEKCLPLNPSLGWRKTGLRTYLSADDIDQYVTRSGGRKTVRFAAK